MSQKYQIKHQKSNNHYKDFKELLIGKQAISDWANFEKIMVITQQEHDKASLKWKSLKFQYLKSRDNSLKVKINYWENLYSLFGAILYFKKRIQYSFNDLLTNIHNQEKIVAYEQIAWKKAVENDKLKENLKTLKKKNNVLEMENLHLQELLNKLSNGKR